MKVSVAAPAPLAERVGKAGGRARRKPSAAYTDVRLDRPNKVNKTFTIKMSEKSRNGIKGKGNRKGAAQ